MFRRNLFTSKALWETGAVILRMFAGLIMFKYGFEIFEPDKMKGYTDWLTDLKFPAPAAMAYAGKISELVGGLFMALGLFTRLVAIPLIITTAVIAFVMGEPEFLAADGVILLMVIYLHFLFTGPGKISLDYAFFRSKNKVDKSLN
jgi:uncharacterized membrane protein YphA (DoxX/SURF4 family)